MSWHKKVYDDIINRGKLRGLNKNLLDYYTECHHIIPRCLGGTDEKSNLVLLTAKEHIICHILLTRIFPNNRKLLFSVISFLIGSPNTKEKRGGNLISVRMASIIREEWGLSQRGIPGHKHTEESKKKISEGNKGKKRSEDFKKKMSEIAKNRPPMSEEARKKSSETHKKNMTAEKIEHIRKINIGRVPSEEQRKRLSLKTRGMKQSEEHNKNLSKAMKGRKLKDETKIKISESLKKNNVHGNIAVEAPNGKVYSSLTECAKEYGVARTTIRSWINKFPEKGFKMISKSEYGLKVQGPDGTIYNSIKDCSKAINRSESTIKRWIKKYPEMGYKFI